MERHASFCRFCHAACPVLVDIEDGDRIVDIRGDRSDPLFQGFTCVKGRQLADHHHHPDRVRTSLRRTPTGSFEPISSTSALDEIASKIDQIVADHGPRAVASYTGTGAYQNSTAVPVAAAWHEGLQSPSFYTSVTIDQPAHRSAALRMGAWEAGWHNFSDSDVHLAIGYNPLASSYGPAGGLQGTNPFVALREAKDRGLKTIVVDPRRTEFAASADIWLQVQPGEDPTLLAGLIREVIRLGYADKAFCSRHVSNIDELTAAVEAFDPGYVARRAGIDAQTVTEAAELFGAAERGSAGTGTGPNMAPHSMLTEHLALCLNAICGRVNRAGDELESGHFLSPGNTRRAAVVPPSDPAPGAAHRVRGLHGMADEMLTNTLADEILLGGPGQVRALIVSGGNPVVAWPDQKKTVAALRALELLVVIDHRMSPTSELADFVIAPRLQLERADVPHIMDRRFPAPYTNYTPAVLNSNDDLLAEWEVFAGIAARNGSPINLPGGAIPFSDNDVKPGIGDEEVLDLVYGSARMPMAEIRKNRGVIHPDRVRVVPDESRSTALLDVGPADVVRELGEVLAERSSADRLLGGDSEAQFPYRLISRRAKHVLNSFGRELPGLARLGTTNPAFMHPRDLASLGIAAGELVRIESPNGAVEGVAEPSPAVKQGVVSMSHAWGTASQTDEDVRTEGSPTNRLVSNERGTDPITGMAVQSAIPVRVSRLG